MRRGEIWWGSPQLPGGSAKRRPFLIVSDDVFNANERYPKLMAVHLTTVVRVGPFDWEVELPRGTSGLERASVAKCGEIYTLLKTDLTQQIGALPAPVMRRVDAAMAVALGLQLDA